MRSATGDLSCIVKTLFHLVCTFCLLPRLSSLKWNDICRGHEHVWCHSCIVCVCVCVCTVQPCAGRCAWRPWCCVACPCLSPARPVLPPGWRWPWSASCGARLGSAGGTALPPLPDPPTEEPERISRVCIYIYTHPLVLEILCIYICRELFLLLRLFFLCI